MIHYSFIPCCATGCIWWQLWTLWSICWYVPCKCCCLDVVHVWYHVSWNGLKLLAVQCSVAVIRLPQIPSILDVLQGKMGTLAFCCRHHWFDPRGGAIVPFHVCRQTAPAGKLLCKLDVLNTGGHIGGAGKSCLTNPVWLNRIFLMEPFHIVSSGSKQVYLSRTQVYMSFTYIISLFGDEIAVKHRAADVFRWVHCHVLRLWLNRLLPPTFYLAASCRPCLPFYQAQCSLPLVRCAKCISWKE